MLGFLLGVAGTLEALARFVAIVDFWRAILDSWHKPQAARKHSEKAPCDDI